MNVRRRTGNRMEQGGNAEADAEAEAELHRKAAQDLRSLKKGGSAKSRLAGIADQAEWHAIASPAGQVSLFRLVPERMRRLGDADDLLAEAEVLASALDKEADEFESLARARRRAALP